MFGLGFYELIIILVIVVLLFGAKRLPELGRGLGEAIRNFKHGSSKELNTQVNHRADVTDPSHPQKDDRAQNSE